MMKACEYTYGFKCVNCGWKIGKKIHLLCHGGYSNLCPKCGSKKIKSAIVRWIYSHAGTERAILGGGHGFWEEK